MQYKGIDVSTWQGDINWKQVEGDNVTFAIVRATYGTTGIDDYFSTNIKGISNTSINPGAYHYSYAQSISDAKSEAQHFLDVISPYEFKYPVAFDIEDESLAFLGKSTLTNITRMFCETVESRGYYVCIYSNLNWITNNLNMSELNQFDVWLSQYSSSPTYVENFGIWQYTSSGSVEGINGDVDMNISYRDYPKIISNAGLNKPSNFSNDDQIIYYTVASGDTLWGIAERFFGSGYKYNEIAVLNNLTSDLIYEGQVLKVPKSNLVKYIVKSGDTLWGIAEKFWGSGTKYGLIMTANGLTSDLIYDGQILIIPG